MSRPLFPLDPSGSTLKEKLEDINSKVDSTILQLTCGVMRLKEANYLYRLNLRKLRRCKQLNDGSVSETNKISKVAFLSEKLELLNNQIIDNQKHPQTNCLENGPYQVHMLPARKVIDGTHAQQYSHL